MVATISDLLGTGFQELVGKCQISVQQSALIAHFCRGTKYNHGSLCPKPLAGISRGFYFFPTLRNARDTDSYIFKVFNNVLVDIRHKHTPPLEFPP